MGTLIFTGKKRLEGTSYIQAIPGLSYPLVIVEYVCEVPSIDHVDSETPLTYIRTQFTITFAPKFIRVALPVLV